MSLKCREALTAVCKISMELKNREIDIVVAAVINYLNKS
jgi:hypothetical protein